MIVYDITAFKIIALYLLLLHVMFKYTFQSIIRVYLFDNSCCDAEYLK